VEHERARHHQASAYVELTVSLPWRCVFGLNPSCCVRFCCVLFITGSPTHSVGGPTHSVGGQTSNGRWCLLSSSVGRRL